MFDDVLARLKADGVRFVVTGGVAVAFHGYKRSFQDLDIVVEGNRAQCDTVMRSLSAVGFYSTIPLHLSEVPLLTFMDANGRRVDVNARYSITHAELVERASAGVVMGTEVMVISRDDLIAVKRRRARDYDVDDVAHLLEGA